MLKSCFIEIQSNKLKPYEIVDRLENHEKVYFLDSANAYAQELNLPENRHLKSKSQFSYIGINPIKEFCYYNDEQDAQSVLRALDCFLKTDVRNNEDMYKGMNEELAVRIKPQFFLFLSYDFGEKILRVNNTGVHNVNLPDIYCALCKDNIIFDHFNEKTYYLHLDECEYSKEELLRQFDNLINSKGETDKHIASGCDSFENHSSNFTVDDYMSTIGKIKNYIYDGHIYQVNLSQIFSFKIQDKSWAIYKKIRKSNAAPFAAFFRLGEKSILSTSPERFLFRKDENIYTEPIKGTRPRGATPEEDKLNCEKLVNSIKERSENIMIVDLLRNDLGRICKYGTVKVEDLLYVEKYPSVLQLISRVVGKIKESLSFGDILYETFPGGSITGCPKLRAVEIIAEMEPNRRSVYTGTIGRISVDQDNFDLSIVIRTIIAEGQNAQLSLGGGIVFDSHPKKEYEETIDKGAAIIKGLKS